MDCCRIYFALVLAMIAIVNSQDVPSISLVADATVVLRGLPARLICYVPSSLNTFVTWQKSTPVTPTVKLATNAMLESTYKPITRYVLSVQNPVPNKPNFLAFHFNITSTLSEDSGNYTCAVPASGLTSSTISLIIVKDLTPPDVVITNIKTNEEFQIADSVFTMEEGAVYNFKCVVTQACPEPIVAFTGDAQIHRKSTITVPTVAYQKKAYPGLDSPTFTVTRTASEAWLDVFSGVKTLSCNASVNPIYLAAMKWNEPIFAITSFSVKFGQFKPRVSCPPSVQFTVGLNTYIVCNLTAPTDSPPVYSWTLSDKSSLSSEIHSKGSFSTDATLREDLGYYVVKLQIQTASENHAGTYTLVVGDVNQNVILQKALPTTTADHEDAESVVGDNMGTRCGIAQATVICIAFTVLGLLRNL